MESNHARCIAGHSYSRPTISGLKVILPVFSVLTQTAFLPRTICSRAFAAIAVCRNQYANTKGIQMRFRGLIGRILWNIAKLQTIKVTTVRIVAASANMRTGKSENVREGMNASRIAIAYVMRVRLSTRGPASVASASTLTLFGFLSSDPYFTKVCR
jgi:hypothetical protein